MDKFDGCASEESSVLKKPLADGSTLPPSRDWVRGGGVIMMSDAFKSKKFFLRCYGGAKGLLLFFDERAEQVRERQWRKLVLFCATNFPDHSSSLFFPSICEL